MHLLNGFMAVRACPAVVPHQTQAETLIFNKAFVRAVRLKQPAPKSPHQQMSFSWH